MWEEIETPYEMVKLNFLGNSIHLENPPTHLGAQIKKKDDNKWYIIINNRQDYEQNHNSAFLTLIMNEDKTKPLYVWIDLINILDNAPVMSIEGPCEVDELKADFLSDCHYTVRHEDGFWKDNIEGQYTNRLDFELPEKEAEFFGMTESEQLDDYSKRFTLGVKKALDYTQRAVFSFPTTVYDFNRTHATTTNLVVQVVNVESRAPIFTRPFTTQRILEKEEFRTTVTAIDGDTGLNRPVCYELQTDDAKYDKYFDIHTETGLLTVAAINRDAEKNELYQFTITAFKCHNKTFQTSNEAAIILDDVNDNVPLFYVSPTSMTFWEHTLMELPFERFNIEDIDLGIHATYNVALHEKLSDQDQQSTESFSIVPNSGYQLANFTITIVNTDDLDYELPERQHFQLIVTATEVANETHTTQQIVDIALRNWNDEIPVFDQETYEVTINETDGKGHHLVTVHITDRDVDDSVNLTIVGRMQNDLTVTELSAASEEAPTLPTFSFEIRIGRDEVFDYDIAPEVLVQLQAKDTLQTDKNEPLHQVFAQLVITVLDVNNKPPSISVPRGRIHIEENSAPNTPAIIGDGIAEIIGTDPDSTADLEFSIDWQSSYAVKGGSQVSSDVFEGCLIIDVDARDSRRVIGMIRVNPALDQAEINNRLDYEKYETLFLTIKLVDLEQVVPPGETEAIVVLQIDDVNDNAPEFVGNTLSIERSVLEEAESGTFVGNIIAIDIDGPLHNKITYSLASQKPEHNGLFSIDSFGSLQVDASKQINCDVPITYFIPLEITLSDGTFETKGEIRIDITDTNNRVPYFKDFPDQIEVFEKSPSGTEINRLGVIDLDRDEPYHTVSFEFDYSTDLQSYFAISLLQEETGSDERPLQVGLVTVKENNRELDRDGGPDRFTIRLKVQDNPFSSGRKNANETQFTLILLDINDQKPVMPLLEELKLSEDAAMGIPVVERFEATDRDDRNTPNAKIQYSLKRIWPDGQNSPEAINIEDIPNLFALEQTDEFVARFVVGHDLKCFYGNWIVDIEACDRGDEYELVPNSPRWCTSSGYTIQVQPVNYMAPILDYPQDDARIRLKFESLANGRPLVNTQGETIPNFRATDTDGGDFGVVTFSLTSQDPSSQDHVYFQLNEVSKNQAQLVLVNADAIEARSYRVTVTATDGGNKASSPANVVIVFIDMTGEPEFLEEDSPFHTDFTENELGLQELRTIPEAIDPKNAELPPEDQKNVFYFIDNAYGSSSHLFQIDKENHVLRLTEELDREEIPAHEIRVIATNSINGPVTPIPANSRSALIVHIKVNDVNDNPPKFRYRSYAAGITVNDYSGKILFQVIADDPDEDDVISYTIAPDSLEAFGTGLSTTPAPFSMDLQSGQLSLATLVQNNMKGYYTFTIVATDLVDHTDSVPAKIYIIAESNRVKFVFLNSIDEVDTPEMRNFLEVQLSKHYEMDCNIDDIVRGTIGETGRAEQDKVTDVRAHFIRNNEAVEAIEILQRSNDRVFVTNLKTALSAAQLLLQDVPNTIVEELDEKSELLRTILIAIASGLALICALLVVAFCIKIRSMNRQLKALSATDFGSIASEIHEGRKLPTTNVFSVEGSNPVLNDKDFTKGAFDDVSVQSYESDFVGIDNDIFAIQRKEDELNPALIEHIKQRSLNPMVNGGKFGPDDGSGYMTKKDSESSTDELSHRF
ncbi:cadherin-23-like isoform X2 [Malaya genurostris]|nr:cadherin-23-like isoform X2 [Malaya genurostris]